MVSDVVGDVVFNDHAGRPVHDDRPLKAMMDAAVLGVLALARTIPAAVAIDQVPVQWITALVTALAHAEEFHALDVCNAVVHDHDVTAEGRLL